MNQILIGSKFVRLTVISQAGTDKHHNRLFECLCDCGKTKVVNGNDLKTGNTKSCGCFKLDQKKQQLTKHGMTETPEYFAWQAMKNRCYREKDEHFHRYGGRGITVCERWIECFENFISDMGFRPSGKHSLDRKNNDGNYEPDNCKWSTKKEQCNNRASNNRINLNGVLKTVAEWSEELGIKPSTILYRINHGWTPERALTNAKPTATQ